jgi:hypothetical protein
MFVMQSMVVRARARFDKKLNFCEYDITVADLGQVNEIIF